MSTTITYIESANATTRVYLNGKLAGTIKPTLKPNSTVWFRYHPKGSKVPGDSYPSIAAVQRSLEQGE